MKSSWTDDPISEKLTVTSLMLPKRSWTKTIALGTKINCNMSNNEI